MKLMQKGDSFKVCYDEWQHTALTTKGYTESSDLSGKTALELEELYNTTTMKVVTGFYKE